jgi:hypothetical protein
MRQGRASAKRAMPTSRTNHLPGHSPDEQPFRTAHSRVAVPPLNSRERRTIMSQTSGRDRGTRRASKAARPGRRARLAQPLEQSPATPRQLISTQSGAWGPDAVSPHRERATARMLCQASARWGAQILAAAESMTYEPHSFAVGVAYRIRYLRVSGCLPSTEFHSRISS